MNQFFTTADAFTQSERFLQVNSTLGKDALLLRRLAATESISSLFSIEVDLLSQEPNIAADTIVGSHLALFIDADDTTRNLNGFVKTFTYTGLEKRGLYGYRATLVPWLWFLDKRTNCRAFQNQNVQEILTALFNESGFSDFTFSLIESHPPLEYCVQYQESDFAFISRLLEQEGLFYFFVHEADKHVLHITDNVAGLTYVTGQTIEHSSGSRSKTYIDQWQHHYQYCSGALAQTDYNFENANASLLTQTQASVNLPNNSALEIFEFPGNYLDKQRGAHLARVRMQQEESRFQRIRANGNIPHLEPGKKFKLLSDEATLDDKKEFFVFDVTHYAFEGSYLDESEDKQTSFYKNSFSCIPASVGFRPEARTPRPRIDGVQTAVVVGAAGDEIYTDKYGRIKLQFHWDRYGERNETSSCWVRVATPWSGNKWGTLNIPRVGQEVVVTFVNGDPDQPLVIGSLYNNTHMPPVNLPADKHYAGLKSRTIKGDASSFNELSLSDAGDTEQVKLHAQKNYHTTVGHDLTSSVTNNATYNVGVDKTTTVGGNVTETIQGNETTHVQSNQDASVKGNRSLTVEGTLTENITGNVTTNYDADHSLSVTANQNLTIGAKQTLSVSADQAVSIGANQTIAVTGNTELSATNQSITITTDATTSATTINLNGQAKVSISVGGSNITVAPQGITLSFGASSVTIDAKGVALAGPMVTLN